MSAHNTYSRWAFLHNDWPVPVEPHPPQNLDALIAKLTYWLCAPGRDHGSGLQFITRSHDYQDEVETFAECLTHLQSLRDLLSECSRHRAENETLRQIVSDVCTALGNGAVCAPDCSLAFMGHVPEEVRLVVQGLRSRAEAAEAERTSREAEIERIRDVAGESRVALIDKLLAAEAEVSRLNKREQEAAKVIAPFAAVAGTCTAKGGWSDTDEITLLFDEAVLARIELSHFRAARRWQGGE